MRWQELEDIRRYEVEVGGGKSLMYKGCRLEKENKLKTYKRSESMSWIAVILNTVKCVVQPLRAHCTTCTTAL